MKYTAILILLCAALSIAQISDKAGDTVTVSTQVYLGQLVMQYNQLVERIRIGNEERVRLEGRILLLQGIKNDSLRVPTSWVIQSPPPAQR